MAYNIFTNILKDLGDGEQAQYVKDKIAIQLTGQQDPSDDPYADYVKAFLRFDNSSNVTVDSKGLVTWSNALTAFTLSTAEFYSGEASLSVPTSNTTGYLVAQDSDLIIGTADFCIELWAYTLTDTEGNGTFMRGDNPNYFLFRFNSNNIEVDAAGLGAVITTSGDCKKVNQWAHYAVTREAGTLRIFVDGVKKAEATGKNTSIWPTTPEMRVRYSSGGERFYGYMDLFRVTIGHCRYNAAFSPGAY